MTRLLLATAISISLLAISQRVVSAPLTASTQADMSVSTPTPAPISTMKKAFSPADRNSGNQSETQYTIVGKTARTSDNTDQTLETVELSKSGPPQLESPQLESPQLESQGLLADNPTGNTLSSDPENVSSSSAQPPARRGLPAPIDSPPFPSSEWQIGGTPYIGVPDTSDTYLLMSLLNKTPMKTPLEKSRIKVYGWANVGANLSTSRHSNFPAAYNVYPNAIDLEQVLLRVERLPDTVQTDHPDWGFHLSNIYGIDYRYTTAKGIFSDQLLKKNRSYGYDPILAYVDLYIPKVFMGMNIRVGRFLSVPDIEAQLAPDNYMYTHSLMYSYDPFTQEGVVVTLKLTSQWQVQGGVTDGNDVAIWNRNRKLTGLAAVQWISKSNNDSIYVVANAMNSAKYAYNNVNHYVCTWSHRFNPVVHTKTEAYYMYERGVPAKALPSNVKPGFTNAWSVINYLEFKLSDKSYLSIRNEIFDDRQGQRTGTATAYTSHGIGLTYWLNKAVALRPELRYEHAYNSNTRAYDQGKQSGQFMAAVDMIYRF